MRPLVKSKQYKDQEYELLGADLKPTLQNFQLRRHTFEVSVLGFVCDTSKFSKSFLASKIPNKICEV